MDGLGGRNPLHYEIVTPAATAAVVTTASAVAPAVAEVAVLAVTGHEYLLAEGIGTILTVAWFLQTPGCALNEGL